MGFIIIYCYTGFTCNNNNNNNNNNINNINNINNNNNNKVYNLGLIVLLSTNQN